ncbi:hypothetical protein OK016_04160 [Vibrio chagasii]|nr:hypothetical protein [Vibrio chagasii]
MPNVDFYSGYHSESDRHSSVYVCSNLRDVSYLSVGLHTGGEMHSDPTNRIGRPRQLYTGEEQRDFKNTFTNVNNCD